MVGAFVQVISRGQCTMKPLGITSRTDCEEERKPDVTELTTHLLPRLS